MDIQMIYRYVLVWRKDSTQSKLFKQLVVTACSAQERLCRTSNTVGATFTNNAFAYKGENSLIYFPYIPYPYNGTYLHS